MRKIVLYTICSLDGAVDDPTRAFPAATSGPAPPSFDAEMERHEAQMLASQDAVLLGRGMYDEWSRYWPASDVQPFADFINRVPKYVVTSSPLTSGWGPAEAIAAPLPAAISRLRAMPGGDLGVHGSITLAQALLAEDLIDEVHLAVGPTLDPQGRRLSDALPDLMRLTLQSSAATPGGGLWLTYQPASRLTD